MGREIQPEGSRTMVPLMGPLGGDARSEDARSAHGGRPSEARLLAIMVGPTVITSRIPSEVVLLRIGLLWTLFVALPSAGVPSKSSEYVSFDFHHFCGNGNFDNLQLLYDQISETVEKQGFFLLSSDGETLAMQKGIVRMNCIDCLDRTNVTQSYLARKSLNLQLQKIGVLSSNECISTITDVYEKFKILWAQNGDDISLEYSGTYALKGDLVRYGRQTLFGLIKDGMSALSRYYLNNFHDGIRQDALDLICGRCTINRTCPFPFQLNGAESLSYLPMASALIVGGLTLTTVTFSQAGRNTQHFVSSVLCAGLAAGALAVVKANGRQLCSRPRLCKLL